MSINIQENISLSLHTTLKTGGVARYLVEIKTVEELSQATEYAKEKGLPVLFIGGGSNLLIEDSGFGGLVILNQLKGRKYQEGENGEVTLICGSGEVLDEVVKETVDLGYWGLENLSAIPGTVGATPVQNVGAYGVEVSQLISFVEVYNFVTKESEIFSNLDCDFSYRESFFKKEIGENYFIVSVHFVLTKNSNPKIGYIDLQKKFTGVIPTISEVRNAVLEIRSQKFPDWKVIGTAGSFFKNPTITRWEGNDLRELFPLLPQYEAGEGMVKISLGYVLDKLCGLKGYREGNVGLYEGQALVLVNYGGATSLEIKKFAQKIADKVYVKTKIVITPEVRFVKNK